MLSEREKETQFYAKYGKNLYRKVLDKILPSREEIFDVNSSIDPNQLTSGNVVGNLSVQDGFLQSSNFVTGSTGWRFDAEGNAELESGYFRGDITGATGTFSGSVTATTGTIGGWNILSGYIYSLASGTPTATPNDGLVMASGNEGITVYENTEKRVELGYLSAGVYGLKVYADDGTTVIFEASDTQKIFNGAYLSASSVTSAKTKIAIQGWTHNLVFSADSNVQVAWATGTIALSDGSTTYAITGANTGTMSAINYIYLDIDTSTTVLQTTTTYSTAIGDNKILVAVAENVAADKEATLQVYGGIGGIGTLLTTANLAANCVTTNLVGTNEIIANTANIANAVITNAKIIDLAVSKLTAGIITSKIITLDFVDTEGDVAIECGKTDFGDDATSGFIFGIDDSVAGNPVKWEMGSSAEKLFKYDGTNLEIIGCTIKTGTSGARIELNPSAQTFIYYNADGDEELYTGPLYDYKVWAPVHIGGGFKAEYKEASAYELLYLEDTVCTSGTGGVMAYMGRTGGTSDNDILQLVNTAGTGRPLYISNSVDNAAITCYHTDTDKTGFILSTSLAAGKRNKGIQEIVESGATNLETCLYLETNNDISHLQFIGDPAVAAPQDGDFWFDGTDLKIRIGATTYTLDKTAI